MAFDSPAVALYLKAQLQTITALTKVQIGAPESIGPRVSAYITGGSQRPTIKTQGSIKREAKYFVDLCYRLDGKEEESELALFAILDAFLLLLYADPTLGGTSSYFEVEMGLADEPDYRTRSGREYREFPCVITACQYGSYNTTPNQ